MTGLEKMKSQILEEAHTCAKKILEEREKRRMKSFQAKKRAEAECRRISRKMRGRGKELQNALSLPVLCREEKLF